MSEGNIKTLKSYPFFVTHKSFLNSISRTESGYFTPFVLSCAFITVYFRLHYRPSQVSLLH